MKSKSLLLPVTALLGATLVIAALAWRYSETEVLKRTVEADLFSQGQQAASSGDCPKAIRVFRAMLTKDPHHAPALEFLADCQSRLRDFQGAAEALERAVEIDPAPARRYKLAMAYDALGLAAKAAGQRRAAATITPGKGSATSLPEDR